MQELDLDRVHRVDVRVPQAHGTLDHRLAVEQRVLLDDLEHRGDRPRVLVLERGEETHGLRALRDEREVAARDLEARLRERHLEVLD